MYIKVGSYQHAPGEANLVNFTVTPRRSSRGFQVATKVRAHVSGEFTAQPGETQYDINAKLEALYNALRVDGFDFGLYHDDNTPTAHFIDDDSVYNLTGNQTIHQSFPASHNGEFSTGRQFAYVIGAEFRASTSLVLDYQETISHTGSTGAKVNWFEHKYALPFYRVEALASLQTIRQQGYATTLGTYLAPPSPILAAPYELEHLRTITRTGPRRFPQAVEAYTIHWSYTFRSPTVNTDTPSVI